MGWNCGLDGWGWIWMGLLMAIVWFPLLVAVVWALRAFTQPAKLARGRSLSEREPDARGLARLAYARGDLERERYLEILSDLEEEAQSAARR